MFELSYHRRRSQFPKILSGGLGARSVLANQYSFTLTFLRGNGSGRNSKREASSHRLGRDLDLRPAVQLMTIEINRRKTSTLKTAALPTVLQILC
jgi:hypothetical protein